MKIHTKKGVTLVEVIIAVAFSTIVIGAACSVLYLGANTFKSGTANAVNQQNAQLAESWLQRYAATAFKAMSTNDESTDGVIYSLSEDTLTVTEQTVNPISKLVTKKMIATISGVKEINLSIEGNMLNYTIVSADNAYRLRGGIVMNNYKDGTVTDISEDGDTLFLVKKSS